MSNLIIGAKGEKMLSLSGSPHVDYKSLIAEAATKPKNIDKSQMEITNEFSQIIKNSLISQKGINLNVAAKNLNATSLANHVNDAATKLTHLAEQFVNNGNVALSDINRSAMELQSIKDLTIEQIQPLLDEDFKQQQNNAKNQPKPKFLDKKL